MSDSHPRRRSARIWLLLGLLGIAGLMLIGQLGGTESGASSDPEGARQLLSAPEIAQALGKDARADALEPVSPPVDLNLAARAASSASVGRMAMPQHKAIVTYRERATGFETTQVVLEYDDPTRAAALTGLAESMLPSALGLTAEPLQIDGADDARAWSGAGYHAVSFRRGGIAVLVGTNDTRDPAVLSRLAEAAKLKISAIQRGGATATR